MKFEKAKTEIFNLLNKNNLISHDDLFDIIETLSDCLEIESGNYRPVSDEGYSGSFLDFRNYDKPVIVVPDLHARPYFLQNILKHKLENGETVIEALNNKTIILVFVGDILHSERNTRDRWVAAQAEYDQGIYTGPSISSEMQEGLSLMSALFKLKTVFHDNCHILKGNHENIMNVTQGGDFGFRKYVDEGNLCRTFIQEYYGDDIVYLIHCVEKLLPLFFAGKKCAVSHAEPKTAYSVNQLINARNTKGVVEGLTWTPNDGAEENSVSGIIAGLYPEEQRDDIVYLGGHRPVNGDYDLRQNGKYIQLHNPSRQNIAIVYPDRVFNPEIDIVEVGNE